MNIDAEFTNFIRMFRGGQPFIEFLSDFPEGTLNADYILPREQVIIELKTLSADSEDLTKVAKRFIESGNKFGYNGSQQIKWFIGGDPIPQQVVHDFERKRIRGIVEVIKKANKQVRDSKKLTKLPNARGVCMLANDSNYGISPRVAIGAIAHAFRQLSECHVDCVVYFTPNIFHDSGDCLARTVWIPVYNVGSEGLGSLVNEMGRKWHEYVEENVERSVQGSKLVPARDAIASLVIKQFGSEQ